MGTLRGILRDIEMSPAEFADKRESIGWRTPRLKGQSAPMPSKTNIALLLANVAGAIIYVVVASRSWAVPQERGLNAATGEPFIWALYVVPIWALFSSLDLVWGTIIAIRRQWRSGRFWLIATGVWLVAAVFDFTHH